MKPVSLAISSKPELLSLNKKSIMNLLTNVSKRKDQRKNPDLSFLLKLKKSLKLMLLIPLKLLKEVIIIY